VQPRKGTRTGKKRHKGCQEKRQAMKSNKASTKVMQGKTQMEAGKCKKSSKKIPVLWLVVVPKNTHFPCFKCTYFAPKNNLFRYFSKVFPLISQTTYTVLLPKI
jgi:hypothetical protein